VSRRIPTCECGARLWCFKHGYIGLFEKPRQLEFNFDNRAATRSSGASKRVLPAFGGKAGGRGQVRL
jgi:hypothetical protein